MIRIKIELLSARTGLISRIGEIDIWNDATGTHKRGNYKFVLRKMDNHGRVSSIKDGELKGFPRLSYTVFELLKRCLNTLKLR